MRVEVVDVLGVLVEVMRRQNHREDRNVGVELHAHQTVDDSRRHEVMTVDTAVDDQTCGDDRLVAAGLGQPSSMQRDLESSRYLEEINRVLGVAELDDRVGDSVEIGRANV